MAVVQCNIRLKSIEFVIPNPSSPPRHSRVLFTQPSFQSACIWNLLLNHRPSTQALEGDECRLHQLVIPEITTTNSSSPKLPPPTCHPRNYHHQLVIPEIFYRGSRSSIQALEDDERVALEDDERVALEDDVGVALEGDELLAFEAEEVLVFILRHFRMLRCVRGRIHQPCGLACCALYLEVCFYGFTYSWRSTDI